VQSKRFSHALLGEVNLHFAESGNPESPRIVLLHGGGANLHWWDHLSPELARTHHVVALDFRGHGDSDFPETREVGAFHLDLKALLAYFGSKCHALVGHSLGAHVALHHAATHSDVAKLVLIEPSRGAERRERRRSRLALAARRTYRTRDEAIARFRFLPDAPDVPEALRQSVAAHSVHLQTNGRYGFKFDPHWFSIPAAERPNLRRVGAHTLLLRGSNSSLLSQEGAAELCAELPLAELVEIEAAGHHVHIEQPHAVLAALMKHLQQDVPRHEVKP
jgi:pimeloyl-ACP methyl ester carboxylesterase